MKNLKSVEKGKCPQCGEKINNPYSYGRQVAKTGGCLMFFVFILLIFLTPIGLVVGLFAVPTVLLAPLFVKHKFFKCPVCNQRIIVKSGEWYVIKEGKKREQKKNEISNK